MSVHPVYDWGLNNLDLINIQNRDLEINQKASVLGFGHNVLAIWPFDRMRSFGKKGHILADKAFVIFEFFL